MPDVKVAMISSTIKDLADHRQKVLEACLRLHVLPSMMEHWPSSDEDGVAASLKKVDGCDIYIGVFAHRYGYIPKKSQISVTEMEYNRAVERNIPRLIFIIDPNHDIKIGNVEMQAAKKLNNLKDRLKNEKVVSFFTSPDDLATKVVHSLSAYTTHKTQNAANNLIREKTVFGPDNYVFFVPYRAKGNQVVGREDALKAIRSQLIAGRRTAIGQTASFQGLGGLGKTQLAVEYAYLFKDQYPNGVIFINADQDIPAQLIQIAETAKWVAPELEHKDKLNIAAQRLRTRSHCLIIFDDLDNIERISPFLPEAQADPHILITSRSDHPEFVPVPLDLLDDSLSLQLLIQEANQIPQTEEDRNAAIQIASRLGGLPLALELAGAYLQHRPVGWARYRDLLNESLKSALPGKYLAASFTRHESDLYSTLQINDEVLSAEPMLKEILDVLTWSGSSTMGQSLLHHLLDNKSWAIGSALSLGISLRMIQKSPCSERYALHRLVREVRREEAPLETKKEWSLKIAKRLASWFQGLKRKFSDLSQFESEIDHLNAWATNVLESSPILSSRIVWLQAYPPFHRGRFYDSYSLLKKSLEMASASASDYVELKADQLSDLCTICTNVGKLEDGRICGEEALKIRLTIYGETHSETAMTLNNLAVNLRVLGEAKGNKDYLSKALDYAKKAHSVWINIHGDKHIDTALALDNISYCYHSLGNSQKALETAELCLAVREEVIGVASPDIISSHTHLGRLYSSSGNHILGIKHEEKALALANQLFGGGSPWHASILNELAVIFYRMGQPNQALEYEQASLNLRKELFSPDVPTVAISVMNIASYYVQQKKALIAISYLENALKWLPKSNPHFNKVRDTLYDLQIKNPRPGFRQPRRR